MELQRQPPSSSTQAGRNRTLSSFVTFLALFLSRGEAFQLNIPTPLRSCTSMTGACAKSTTTTASSTSANSFPNGNSSNSHRTTSPQRQQQQQQQSPSSRRISSRSKTTAYYSNTSDPPFSSSSPDKRAVQQRSFAERMRSIALKRDRQESSHRRGPSSMSSPPATKSTRNPHKPPFVHEAISLAAYKALVADEPEAIVVVRFYAKWCKACKAVEPSFYRLARSMSSPEKEEDTTLSTLSTSPSNSGPQKKNLMKFVEVPVLEENANLHQGLGVASLPFAHIYSPAVGLVEELKMAKKDFKTFQQIVQTYRDGECTDLALDEESGMFLSPYDNHHNKDAVAAVGKRPAAVN